MPGVIVNFVVGIWMLMAMTIAVKLLLNYTNTWRAAGICIM